MEVIYPGSTANITSIMPNSPMHESILTDQMELYRASLRKETVRKRASTVGVPQTTFTPTRTEDGHVYARPSSLHVPAPPRSVLKGIA